MHALSRVWVLNIYVYINRIVRTYTSKYWPRNEYCRFHCTPFAVYSRICSIIGVHTSSFLALPLFVWVIFFRASRRHIERVLHLAGPYWFFQFVHDFCCHSHIHNWPYHPRCTVDVYFYRVSDSIWTTNSLDFLKRNKKHRVLSHFLIKNITKQLWNAVFFWQSFLTLPCYTLPNRITICWWNELC